MKEDEGYSVWTLQPKNQIIAAKYNEYTREKIKKISIPAAVVCFFFSALMYLIAFKQGAFKLKVLRFAGVNPAISFFSLLFIAGLSILICSLVSCRLSIAIELIIPLFCFTIVAILTPLMLLDDNLLKPTWFKNDASLLQLLSQMYLVNFGFGVLLTSNFNISVASRVTLYWINLNCSIRRWTAGHTQMAPMLFNLLFAIALFEASVYTICLNRVQLFLEKERFERQQEQTHSILQKIPTNVMVLSQSTD